jgi:hypothetical protein
MDVYHYKEELLNQNNSFEKISRFISPFIPKNLYRYSNFKNKYWENMIYKGEVYLTPANQFNDPFDCLFYANLDRLLSSDKFLAFLYTNYPILKEYNLRDGIDDIMMQVIVGMQNDIRAVCFSETWSSILMWSHYADCHRGFCIEYDTESMSEFKKQKLFPVLYLEDQFDVTNDIINTSPNAGLITMVGKANEWNYEKEWRMVFQKDYTHTYLYFRREIKSIILGLNCEDKHTNKICDWAKENNKNVYRAKISQGKYEINKEKII